MARERLSTLLILELTDHGWSQTLREHDRKLIHQDIPPLTLRPFLTSGDKEVRKQIIAFVRQISEKCRQSYERLKQGLPVIWPEGVFIPWLPPKEFSSFALV
jgi:hypothetical protein